MKAYIPVRKSFADNQRVTVAEAIRATAGYRDHTFPISIATGYFNLGGFISIADVLEAAPEVRILIGAEPEAEAAPDTLWLDRDDPEKAVQRVEDAIVAGRNDLEVSHSSDENIQRLKAFLVRESTQVRIYRQRFLHGKAFVFGTEEAVIAGSANFTKAGLNYNLELDLGHYEPDRVSPIAEWYDTLWGNAEDYDLAGIFNQRILDYEPHQIYLRMLYAQYSAELHTDEESQGFFGTMQLADFQRIGSQRAIRILDAWNGAILADGVGLGKTVIAGDIIKTFAIERGLRVLVVCPATLREMWETFLRRNNLPGSVLSYSQLGRDQHLGGDAHHLLLPPQQYRLIVADEAHVLRTPGTQAYSATVKFLSQSPDAKLLLLTATPVNNSLWDLYWEVMLFAKTDSRFSTVGIPDLRTHIKVATKLDPEDLDPAHLFAVLDAISVRRTRSFIKEHFPYAKINGQIITFPTVVPHAERYDMDSVVPGLFEKVADAIEHRLHMARYRTHAEAYSPRPNENANRQEFMAGLLRSQMLKRFESSAFAFLKTLEAMITNHEACLLRIERDGLVPSHAISADVILDDEGVDALLAEGDLSDATDFDTDKLCRHLREDIAILRDLEGNVGGLKLEDDPKIAALLNILRAAASFEDSNNRKTLVFTSFVDTVEYIKVAIEEAAKEDELLRRLLDRSAFVLGHELADVDERTELACGFAPLSMKPDDATAPNLYDLLVTTDVLAEGQNLQQCGRIINFDLPWNPMRVVQRNGRIDRIGSPHSHVNIHCFMPDVQLDAILRLELRLQRKIAHANAAIGLESAPIPGMAAREQIYTDAEQIEEAKLKQIERIASGDATVLEELDQDDAYSGEQFREELRQALLGEAGIALSKLPWGIGSGHAEAAVRGIVFLARAGRRHFFRYVRLESSDEPIEDDLLASLKLARCSPAAGRHYPNSVRRKVYDTWQRVRRSIYVWLQEQRDPASRQGRLPKAQRDAIALLERAPDDAAARAAEALTTRWPADVERDLREILRDDATSDSDKLVRLTTYVLERGLKPQAVEVVPNVREDDIKLICYQVVSM